MNRRANEVDLYVGKRIRLHREINCMSQEQLANQVGVSFQQLQKYELGTNRVSASRLYDIARAIKVDVASLYDGLPHSSRPKPPRHDLLDLDKESLEILGLYRKIKSDRARKTMLEFLRTYIGPDS